jgi:hypothetical protein
VEFLDPADPEEGCRTESRGQFPLDSLRADVSKETKGGKYQSLALASTCREPDIPMCDAIPLEPAMRAMVADRITAGFGQMGEVFVSVDSEGEAQREFHRGTCLPHDWNQALKCACALR